MADNGYSDSSSPSDSSSQSVPDSPTLSTPPNLHQNSQDPEATWLIQKYGGTSIGKFAAKIAEEIIPPYLDQHKLAIVCSARSGSTKTLGTTNLLIKAAEQAVPSKRGVPKTPGTPGTSTPLSIFWGGRPNSGGKTSSSPTTSPARVKHDASCDSLSSYANPSDGSNPSASNNDMDDQQPFAHTVDLIKHEHLSAAESHVHDEYILEELSQEIERDCETLKSYLSAAQVIGEISPRSKDNIIGVGERLACKLLAAILRDRNIDSEYVSLEDIAPPLDFDSEQIVSFGNSGSSSEGALPQEWYDSLAEVVANRVRACGARVPVVTGFFSPVPFSLLATIGRGYTDLLASLLAAGIQASELQIWKEVDGIFTADPNKVPTARLLPTISPEEAAELTFFGSEVVHPFTMEQVMRCGIPIRIKNVRNPLGRGTVILPHSAVVQEQHDHQQHLDIAAKPPLPPAPPWLHEYPAIDLGLQQAKRLPTAVTYKDNIVVLNIHSNRKSVSHGFLAGIFAVLDRFGVVVDLISTSEVHVSMAIQMQLEETSGSFGGKGKLERLVRELRKTGTVSVHHDMAILSLVGSQMASLVGMSGLFFTTLGEGRINIEMISQGASEINISCVIKGRDAVKALNLVHQSCLQIRPEGGRGRVGPWLF